MKKRIFFSVLSCIIIVSLAGFMAFAGDSGDKAKAPDSLKAELTEQQDIHLSWTGTEKAQQFNIYRSAVNEITEDLDYAELEFIMVETVKETAFIDKILTDEAETEASPAMFVYYVTAVIDEDGTESPKSNFAEVNLLVEPEEKIIN